MKFVIPRCNYAGPLGKSIPTRSLCALFVRLCGRTFRIGW
jgi:hypothetical protein